MRALALAPVLAALLASAALSASGDGSELIRFRTADGVLGLVDAEEKVPPGATILSREPKLRRAAPAGEAAAAPAAPARPPAAAAPVPWLHEGGPREGDEPPPSSDEEAAAAYWCRQGRSRREAREQAEAWLVAAQERYERCRYATEYCSMGEVEAAEARVEDASADEEALAEACRRAECLPGWIREGCERFR